MVISKNLIISILGTIAVIFTVLAMYLSPSQNVIIIVSQIITIVGMTFVAIVYGYMTYKESQNINTRN